MNKIALSLLAGVAVAGTALAGHEVSHKEYKNPPAPEPCFRDQELQLDVFGSYSNSQGGGHGDGFGGGLGVNYFFMRYLGVGVDGNVFDAGVNGVWDLSARVIARFPIDSACIAPYVFAGGGYQTNSTNAATIVLGGGLEWRATRSLGLFSEGRYTFAGSENDAAQARVGVRFVF